MLPAALVTGLRGVDLILHAGDLTQAFVLDLLAEIAPVEAVAGNNDPPELVERLGRRRIVTLGDVRIGLTHGDIGRGRSTPERALSVFTDDEVDVVAFGHSHIPLLERRAGRVLLNPGSPTDKRREPACSFALLDIGDGEIRSRLVRFETR